MKRVCLIPCRSGSKRVANKNIKNILGTSLLEHAIKRALNTNVFDRILVCTDSDEYANLAITAGAEIPGIRPEELSTSKSPDIEWLTWLNEINYCFRSCDIYTILRTTSPFLSSKRIAKEVNFFQEKIGDYDSARGVTECTEHPFKMWTVKGEYISPIFPYQDDYMVDLHSSQKASLPKVYKQTGGIEISNKKSFNEYKNITGARIKGIWLNNMESFDVNTEDDWAILSSQDWQMFENSLK